MTEAETEAETEGPSPMFRIRDIPGIRIRRRVDPALSRERHLYHVARTRKLSVAGRRTTFTIFDHGNPLYTTKVKGSQLKEPLPIAKGGEMHYRDREFPGYLLSGNKHTQFSLRTADPFGKEQLSLTFSWHNGSKSVPRDISITFFLKDSLVPEKLANKRPQMTGDGEWQLDFSNRPVIASIRNCIFVHSSNGVEFVVVRKVERDMIEVDAVEIISPMAVFSIVIALFAVGNA